MLLEVIFTTVFALMILMAAISWARAVRAYLKAIGTRLPSMSLISAMTGYNLFFRPELYTEERGRWIACYWRNVGYFLIWWLIGFITGILSHLAGGPIKFSG